MEVQVRIDRSQAAVETLRFLPYYAILPGKEPAVTRSLWHRHCTYVG